MSPKLRLDEVGVAIRLGVLAVGTWLLVFLTQTRPALTLDEPLRWVVFVAILIAVPLAVNRLPGRLARLASTSRPTIASRQALLLGLPSVLCIALVFIAFVADLGTEFPFAAAIIATLWCGIGYLLAHRLSRRSAPRTEAQPSPEDRK